MGYENKENSGALFKVEDRKSDKHPNYNGSVNVAGTEYWISAWINVAKSSGETYMSLKVNPKDAKPNDGSWEGKHPITGKTYDETLDDDIPF